LGTPDLIIPNAAIVTFGSVLSVTPEIWTRELQVNLTGAFYLAQAGARRLVAKACSGRIVFVGSWAAHAPHPSIPAYSAAKAGLRMTMKCMALELAEKRILVNEVAPGYVDAGLSGRCFERDPASRVKAREQVPIQVLISSEDVALQVAHLCQPAIRQMTGSVIVMDGGLSLSTPEFSQKRAESSSKSKS
jgi:NAD(P)-dependent dehydrogenase (short-subunit alcohol dehydrogenase family)